MTALGASVIQLIELADCNQPEAALSNFEPGPDAL